MKPFQKLLLPAILLSTALLTVSCSEEMQSKNLSETDSTTTIPVETAVASRGSISAYYATTASLEAEQEAMVVAKVRGIIREINVEEGDYVEAGQILARLEDEQLAIEAQRTKSMSDRLYNEYQRDRKLFEQKLISLEEYENTKFEYEAQKAAHELAELKIRQSRITAPISGIVSRRLVKAGNMITADQEVFQVTDFSPLLAVMHLPEHEMNKIRKGQSALVQVDALPGEQFQGVVERISPVVDRETGTFKVTVMVSDDTQRLKPGMFGRIRIIYDTHENALLIPKGAVIQEDGRSMVYRVEDGMAFRQEIRSGYVNGRNLEVLEGLGDRATVVTVGQSSLQDSTLIEIVTY